MFEWAKLFLWIKAQLELWCCTFMSNAIGDILVLFLNVTCKLNHHTKLASIVNYCMNQKEEQTNEKLCCDIPELVHRILAMYGFKWAWVEWI